MKLNFKVFGSGKPVIILHGLFGMLDNWQQFAKQLANNYTVYILDIRNHGKSPHSDIFNYDVMSEDLVLFLEKNNITKPSLIGHSMGGKLALKFAINRPKLLDKIIVIDIGIKKYNPRHTSILTALNSLNLNSFASRDEIDKAISVMIKDRKIRQFLLKNIARNKSESGYHWKMNISAITKGYPNIIDKIDFPNNFEKNCLFIKGENSDYIPEADKNDIRKHIPNARFTTIPKASHWVHVENSQLLLKVVNEELSYTKLYP